MRRGFWLMIDESELRGTLAHVSSLMSDKDGRVTGSAGS